MPLKSRKSKEQAWSTYRDVVAVAVHYAELKSRWTAIPNRVEVRPRAVVVGCRRGPDAQEVRPTDRDVGWEKKWPARQIIVSSRFHW